MRMHGFALRLLINDDVKIFSAWLGYKKDLSYVIRSQKKQVTEKDDFWNKAENVGTDENDTFMQIQKLLEDNKPKKPPGRKRVSTSITQGSIPENSLSLDDYDSG
jgi:hypothetical protein